jgi:hypothetical protein
LHKLFKAVTLPAYIGGVKIGHHVCHGTGNPQITIVAYLNNPRLFRGKPLLTFPRNGHLHRGGTVKQDSGYGRYYRYQNRDNDDA